jgi:hypothetical protein
LSCMKVNANIYCLHSASFQSLVKDSPEFTQGGRRLLHNIKALKRHRTFYHSTETDLSRVIPDEKMTRLGAPTFARLLPHV